VISRGGPGLFKRNLDRAERKFDVMQALGAPMMLACSNVGAPSEGGDELAAEQLYELAERARRRNLLVGYEALAWGKKVNHYEHAWKIVQRVNHPHLGLILDSFHMLSLGDDPQGIAAIPGDKIFFVQVADAPRMAMDVLQWSRHYRCFPGQGQFDLANFMVYTLAAGYTGPVSLEVFNDLFREAPNRRTSIDAMQSLLYLEAKTRERLEAENLEAEQLGKRPTESVAKSVLSRVELFDPPAVPVIDGFAFIEFAVRDDSERALTSLLEAMGFRRSGRHRSKNVTLYQQGSINLVINRTGLVRRRAVRDPRADGLCDKLRCRRRGPRAQSRDIVPLPAIREPRRTRRKRRSRRSTRPMEISSTSCRPIWACRSSTRATSKSARRRRPRIREAGSHCSTTCACASRRPAGHVDTVLPRRAWHGARRQASSSRIRTARQELRMSRTRIARSDSCSMCRKAAQRRRRARSRRTAARASITSRSRDRYLLTPSRRCVARASDFVPISPTTTTTWARASSLPTDCSIACAVRNPLRPLRGRRILHIYTDTFADRFFFEIIQRTVATTRTERSTPRREWLRRRRRRGEARSGARPFRDG
jgi:sugar phosphate isomerase/epimerase